LNWPSQEVATKEEAVDALNSGMFDILIAALCMKPEGGRSIARTVQYIAPEVKVYLVTSWKGDFDFGVLKQDGIQDVFKVGIEFNDFKARVLS